MISSVVMHRLHQVDWALYHFGELDRTFPLHFHDCLLVGCLLRGRRKLVIAGSEYIIEAGDVVLVPPYTPHACEPVSQEPCEWICLHGAFSCECGQTAQIWPKSSLSRLFAALANCPTQEQLGTALRHLIHNSPSCQIRSGKSGTENIMSSACIAACTELLQRNDATNNEKIRFLRRFQTTWGITPGRYKESMRVNHAKRLIKSGASLIIAAEGFCDQSHLNRVFKKHLGVTPGVWRTSWESAR